MGFRRVARRIWRIFARCVLWLLGGVAFLLLLVYVAFLSPYVQREAAQLFCRISRETVGIHIELERLRLDFPAAVDIRNFVCYDQNEDTLIYAGHVTSSLSFLRRGGMYLGLGFTTLEDGYFQLIGDSTGQNVTVVAQRFKKDPNKPPRSGRGFEMDIEQVVFSHSRYRMRRAGPRCEYADQMDYRDMDVYDARGVVHNFYLLRDTVAMRVEGLSCREKSGFSAERLDVKFRLCSTEMVFEDISLRTKEDEVHVPLFRMDYDGWHSMSDFYSNVRMQGELERSRVRCRTLGYFFRSPYMPALSVWASGRFEGTVDAFRVRDLSVDLGESTHLQIEGKMEGLPNVHESLVSAEITELSTTPNDIGLVASAWRGQAFTVSPILQGIRQISYRGEVVGFLDDFVAYGKIRSNMGVVGTDLGISYSDRGTFFHGGISTQRLQLQRVLRDTLLGRVTLSAQVDGQALRGGAWHTQLDGTIDSVEVHGRTYTGITAQGLLTPERYAGALNVQNELLDLHFDGLVDLAEGAPHFRFRAASSHADLYGMGIIERDSIADLALSVEAELRGSGLDSYEGAVHVTDIRYRNGRGDLALDRLAFEARNVLGGKVLSVDSKPLHATLWGARQYADILPGFARLLSYHFPGLFEVGTVSAKLLSPVASDSIGLPYRAAVRVGEVNPLLRILLPGASVAQGTYLNCGFDGDRGEFDLYFQSDSIGWQEYGIAAPRLHVDRHDSVAKVALNAEALKFRSLALGNARLDLAVGVDELRTDLSVEARGLDSAQLDLHAVTNLQRQDSGRLEAVVRLLPSNLRVLDRLWRFSPARIIVDTSRVAVHNLSLQTEGPRVRVYGVASRSAADTLHLLVENMDLSLLNRVLTPIEITGDLEGDVAVASAFREPSFSFLVSNQDLMVNGAYIGTSGIKGNWRGREYPFQIGVRNRTLGGRQDLLVDMLWDVEQKRFGGKVHMDSLSLGLLAPLSGGSLDGKGGISADIALSGSLDKPRAQGTLRFKGASIKVAMLNKWFNTQSAIRFWGDRAYLRNFSLAELTGGLITVNGTVLYADFSDLRLDLTGKAQHMQLLNTGAGANSLYYGTVVSSATVGLKGPLHDLRLTVNAQTDPGTNLTIEMPSQVEAKSNSALAFVKPRDEDEEVVDSVNLISPEISKLLTVNANVTLTKEALAKVVIDPRTGAMLQLRGDGRLHMELEPQMRIPQIYGDYTIARGEYTFVFEGIVSKKFRIIPGSVLRFTGNPEQAYADISAVYRTRASLDKLLGGAAQEKYKRRIPVDCTIRIAGTLQKPKISFSVSVPQADPETQSLLAASLNTEEKVMRQFASLVVLNMFAGSVETQGQIAGQNPTAEQPNAEQGDNAASPLLSTFWEMLFNQVNSWISQIDKAPSIALGFNYRPGSGVDRYSEDEAEVSVSMQWFDGRLNVDANWDVNKNNTSSAVAGDINVTQQSLRFPHLQYKAFARSNDDLVFSDLNPYTAGAGVVYSNSFNTWTELWHRFLALFRRRESVPEENETPTSRDSVPPTESPAIP